MTNNTPYDARPEQPEYVGFGPRVLALILDVILLIAITSTALVLLYGSVSPDLDEISETLSLQEQLTYSRGPGEFLIDWVFPGVYYIGLWAWICATPGKLALRMAVVDAKTGQRASLVQYIIRYLAYAVSLLPLCLGFFAVLWDKRKQGWHDKIAGTVVIVNENRKTDF